MKKSKEKNYFNFPIALFTDYLDNRQKCLENARDYGIIMYGKTIKKDDYFESTFDEEELERFGIEDVSDEDPIYLEKLFRLKIVEERFKIYIEDFEETIENGEALYDSFDGNKEPMTNMSVDIWDDFYNNYKTEWDNIVFLAYLAVRSIIGDKNYCKTVYKFIFGRMAGKRKSIDEKSDLPKKLQKYYTEHYQSKIRLDLEDKWHMKCYSGRGLYLSFIIDYEQLVTIAKKKNIKHRKKESAITKKNINIMIDNRLRNELEDMALGNDVNI